MWWLLLLYILLAPLLFILYLEIKNYSKLKQINKLPGPPAIPILGNAHQMGKTPSAVFAQLLQWWTEAGHKNFRLLIGPFHNILVTEAKDVEFILTSKTLIDKSDVYDMLHPWLGTGLLTSTGRKWHTHRKIITPSFHFKVLQSFHETMVLNTNKFVDKLRQVSQGDSIFDFQHMAHYLTMDIIAETAMGVSINAMDHNDGKIVETFKEMCNNTNMRIYHPIKRSNTLYKFTPDYLQYCRILKILQDFTNEVIAKRIEKRKLEENQNPKGKQEEDEEESEMTLKNKHAFLDTLLSATVDGRPLTQYEIYEEVSTFMFEGHDTTTSGLCFVIYLLSIFPEIQKKVYAEQQKVLGDNINGEPTHQQIADMQYLDMVIKESLRLYPSVPMVGRCPEKDYDMNGFVVPKGTSLNILIMALGYNEEYFPDPHRMDPERWSADKRLRSPFEYVPFSAGPRNCIGQKFAILELKSIVSKLVRSFEILPPLDELVSTDGYTKHFVGLSPDEQKKRVPNPSKYTPILTASLVLKSENGIWLRLRERV